MPKNPIGWNGKPDQDLLKRSKDAQEKEQRGKDEPKKTFNALKLSTDKPLDTVSRKSNKEHDWGLGEAFQNRNLLASDRQRAKDDSDVSYRSLENQEREAVSADGKLDSSQQRSGYEAIRRVMRMEHKSNDDLKNAGVNPKENREA